MVGLIFIKLTVSTLFYCLIWFLFSKDYPLFFPKRDLNCMMRENSHLSGERVFFYISFHQVLQLWGLAPRPRLIFSFGQGRQGSLAMPVIKNKFMGVFNDGTVYFRSKGC